MNRIVFIFLTTVFTSSIIGQNVIDARGAIFRSDTLEKNIYLCFTGHDLYEGFDHVLKILEKHEIEASFFLTGDFIRNNSKLVEEIDGKGHFVGAHSDKHLLYCDWTKRDSLLHTNDEIKTDILNNLNELGKLDIHPQYFMPSYEWYNKQVVEIANDLDQITVNFSPGTRSNADYTTPEMKNYISSTEILASIYEYEKRYGMNGFHLLIHPGTSPLRKDKLYLHLDELITDFKGKGYQFYKFD